jgi:DnaJ domain
MSDRARVDHYRVLGIGPEASASEVRDAYRRLAREHHPDVNPNPAGPQRFHALTRAYETLRNPAERARYDETRTAARPTIGRADPAGGRLADTAPDRPPRRGTLVLSPVEAAHLLRAPLTLRDAGGATIVLPAGTAHGDHITVVHGNRTILLTVYMWDVSLTTAGSGLFAGLTTLLSPA